nr:NAD(P)H-dependent oxidoreductase [Candidatus Sigynarchaeota archaeon]
MHVSVILAHPDKGSFNHAIVNTAIKELKRSNHVIAFHDLYAEKFDPILPAGEIYRAATLPASIARHCDEIARADGIVIVHPNWWGQPPAIMKGWVDRILRPGVAYKFLEGDDGEGIPVGLLKARVAIIFNTSNTPADREERVFGDPLDSIWKRCIFQLCGIENVHREMFRVVVGSTAQQRAAWLEKARNIVEKMLPPDF